MPEKLVIPCIKAGTKEGDIVLDPFAGTNTVGLVARKLQRNFLACDLSQKYCDMAKQRMEKDFGMLF